MPVKKTILYLCLSIAFFHYHAAAQTWNAPVSVVSPFNTGGTVGQYSKLLVVNGNPAMACYDGTRGNLVFVHTTNASGTAFGTAVTLDSALSVGTFLSLAIVNGNPAVAYYDATNADLKYVRATDVSGNTWGAPLTIDATGTVGQYTSLQIVNGNPAIAYYDGTNSDLKYIRATDASGAAWGTPAMIDGTGISAGLYASLQIVNGNPAISYYDATNSDLKYVRATDASGSTWGSPVVVDGTATSVGQYTSLQIINGNPAVSYFDLFNNDLKYVRATDVSGTTWGSPVVVDGAATSVGQYSSLQTTNGNPAIAYYDASNADLKYVRATDASGTTWGTPAMIDGTGVTVGQYSSLQTINGNPAVAYYDVTNADLKYIRATDVSGTAWGTAINFEVTGMVGQHTSLKIINGNPAIAYYDGINSDLVYVRATNATGTAWGTPVTVDGASVNVGQYISLQSVNDNPAITYYDATNGYLKYVRATDATGTTWGTPIIIDATGTVGQFSSLQIINGNPAVAYYDGINGDLKYVRATDASGTTWGTPAMIDGTGVLVGQYTSLKIVNGNPAVAYYDGTNGDLKYVRATDASGTTWGTPVMIDGSGFTAGQFASLQIVNGFPAISYYDGSNGDLKYIRATDASGTAWGTPAMIDGTGVLVGQYTSLQIVNGNPAIAYYDVSNADLKYVQATDVSGTTWGTPVTLDAVGNAGQYVSLISGSTGAGISYYSSSQALPYFISTTLFTLPVKLTNIKAYQKNNGVQVEWTAQQESNLDRYEVEKSSTGLHFDKLGIKPAAGTSNVVINYSFFDPNPFGGENFYRIKSIDKDGQFTYSGILKVNINSNGVHTFSVYPNPVQANSIAIQMNLAKGIYVISLTNNTGQQIMTKMINHTGGSASENIEPANTLVAGVYQLNIKGNGIDMTRKLIKN